MRTNDTSLDDTKTELRRNYRDALRRRILELRAFAGRCTEGRLTAAEIDQIHMRVRSLAGSGATYGHADVSEAASRFDHALGSPTAIGLKTLASLADNLAEICEKAVSAPEDSHHTRPFAKAPPHDESSPVPVLLTVDDDPAIHELVQAIFKDSAHVIAAYSGAEALDAIRCHCPDLILLDNTMPGMNGLQLLENLGEEENMPPVPVIMLTAENRPREIMLVAAAGVADYIAKPFEPQELSEKISALFRRLRMTVLLAGGNGILRDLNAGRLRRLGFNVVEAATGERILELALERMPELIVLDQSTPGISGGAVLHALRGDKRTRHIPMLYISVDSQGRKVIEGLNTGAIDRTVTPFVPEKMTARILDALGMEA